MLKSGKGGGGIARPCIVVAGSGMCTGGRIQTYLKALPGDRRTNILFVGYLVQGEVQAKIALRKQLQLLSSATQVIIPE